MNPETSKPRLSGSILLLSIRLLVDHILQIAIFFTSLAVFGYVLGENVTKYVSIILSTAALFVMAYLDAWRSAAADIKSSRLNGTKIDRFKGMKAGAISQLPGLVLCLLILLHAPSSIPAIIYRWLYIGLFIPIQAAAGAGAAFVYFIPCVLMAVMSALGYELGRKQVRIINYTYYSNGKNRKTGRK